MQIPESLRLRLLDRAQSIINGRSPDLIIGENYVRRWMLRPRNCWWNLYLHQFFEDDSDRALHDHEPDNVSIILENSYIEHFHKWPLEIATEEVVSVGTFETQTVLRFKTTPVIRRQGDIIFRRAGTPHRIEMIRPMRGPVTTLFIQGPRRRRWGFHCVHGWKHWKDYVDPDNFGKIGKGCG